MKRLLGIAALILSCSCAYIFASAPTWWAERGLRGAAYDESSEASINANYNIALQGQLMHIAKQAAAELDAKYPQGAGDGIHALINSFDGYSVLNPSATSANLETNYKAINIGQLKAVSKLFYDRLWEIHGNYPEAITWPLGITFSGGAGKYPWADLPLPTAANYDSEMNKNYILANIGQLKFLFSWSLAAAKYSDVNNNGVDDRWEIKYFGNLTSYTPDGDLDGDGISNLDEYLFGTNPAVDDTLLNDASGSQMEYNNLSMVKKAGPSHFTRDSEGNIIEMIKSE